MISDEGPEQGIPDFGPRAFGFIGHFQDVVRSGNVGFGGERSAIGELRHAVDIGNHDPIIGVDEEFHEPLVDRMWIEAAKQHEIPQHHESLDVVAVGFILELSDDAVDGRDAGGGVVERFRDGSGVLEKIEISDFGAAMEVNAMHELPPTHDLADESFEGVEWNMILMSERGIDDFLRRQQSDVQHRS